MFNFLEATNAKIQPPQGALYLPRIPPISVTKAAICWKKNVLQTYGELCNNF